MHIPERFKFWKPTSFVTRVDLKQARFERSHASVSESIIDGSLRTPASCRAVEKFWRLKGTALALQASDLVLEFESKRGKAFWKSQLGNLKHLGKWPTPIRIFHEAVDAVPDAFWTLCNEVQIGNAQRYNEIPPGISGDATICLGFQSEGFMFRKGNWREHRAGFGLSGLPARSSIHEMGPSQWTLLAKAGVTIGEIRKNMLVALELANIWNRDPSSGKFSVELMDTRLGLMLGDDYNIRPGPGEAGATNRYASLPQVPVR